MRAKGSWPRTVVLVALFILALAPAVEAVQPVKSEFSFADSLNFPIHPDSSPPFLSDGDHLSYTHILDNGDFWGNGWVGLEVGDLIEIDNGGMAIIGFGFGAPSGNFVLSVSLDGRKLGEMEYKNVGWLSGFILDLDEDALNFLETNRYANIDLTLIGDGSVTILSSTIHGEGTVVPEPLSILLFGSSLVGLGIWKRKEILSPEA